MSRKATRPRPVDPLSVRLDDTIRVTHKIGGVTVTSTGTVSSITDVTRKGWVTYIATGVALYRHHAQLGTAVPGGLPVQLIELLDAAPEPNVALF